MSVNFWQKKVKVERYVYVKNVISCVIEYMIENDLVKNDSEAINKLIEEPKLYNEIIEKLKEDYPDIDD